MLGVDDHELVGDEPMNPEDLFGEDETPLLPVLEDDRDGENGPGDATTADKQIEKRKRRLINRLPNLNEKWLTNSKMEGLHKVNDYFKDINFKEGKGQEKTNLKHLLKRYEYWAQQCYPKLCFQDFVEKVELLSGKKMIKRSLQEIRQSIPDKDIEQNDELDLNVDVNYVQMNDLAHNYYVSAPTSVVEETSISTTSVSETSSSPPAMTDDMRELIRRKREEALAKRKRKHDESINASPSEGTHENTLTQDNSESMIRTQNTVLEA